jgi:hypothetical protein
MKVKIVSHMFFSFGAWPRRSGRRGAPRLRGGRRGPNPAQHPAPCLPLVPSRRPAGACAGRPGSFCPAVQRAQQRKVDHVESEFSGLKGAKFQFIESESAVGWCQNQLQSHAMEAQLFGGHCAAAINDLMRCDQLHQAVE